MENAASSTGDHVDLTFDDHRLRYRRFINDDHRLRTHGDRRFISTTTDYARMEIAISSTGDHVDLV